MKLEPLCTTTEHPELAELTRIICSARYFRKMAPEILTNILKQGSLVELGKDNYLIREGDDTSRQMYILVEGSLAIMSNKKFILRLDLPGDVVGEVAVIQSAPRSADVITETACRLIAFPAELFNVDENSQHASILYILFAHIMAAKLRITTAQSLIHKNQRVTAQNEIKIGIIDANPADRSTIRAATQSSWPEASVIEIDNAVQFVDYPTAHRFDLIIADVGFFADVQQDRQATSSFIRATQLHGAHIFILSDYCKDAANREFLIQQGVDDVMAKPCTPFDLKHAIARFRILHYMNLELDEAENAAETDRLTGLANRRRLDEFLNALVTLYPENTQPFSLLMCDVDNFKHYNDTNGHPMGDVVLEGVAALLANNVRRGDLAARFGGEEFVIVLPDCGKSAALELAEKLRAAVESADFPHQDKQPSGNLTATLGVATFPGDALELDDLLKLADQCLYEGKNCGRNVVVAARPK